jgi:ppGpp synthetase/RelA/SpoT-type nucleotidyltranferase
MPRRSNDEAVMIEDLLREEYFDLLPEIRRLVWQLDTEIRYYTLPILRSLKSHEQLVIKSRVKECESAIKTLRGSRDSLVFTLERADEYSMLNLPDLAGVRVLVFPNYRVAEVDLALRPHFEGWTSKPVRDSDGNPLAPKYFGYCEQASRRVRAEYQIVPMLLGLFWEVEHSAMYKSELVANSNNMQKRRAEVENALSRFEEGIASLLPDGSQPS